MLLEWHFTLDAVAWPAHWLAEEPDLVELLKQERDDTVAHYRARPRPGGAPRESTSAVGEPRSAHP